MNDCTPYEELIAGRLFSDLNPDEQQQLETHLASCPACRAVVREMEATLQATAVPVRPEPPADFWEEYYERLEARMHREDRRPRVVDRLAGWLQGPARLDWEALLLGPRWAYQLSGAVALLAAGVLIGWLLFGNAVSEVPQVAEQPETATPVQAASVNERADRYLERSRVLLMGLVNLDPEHDLSLINLSRQQQVAGELIEEASALKAELSDEAQEQLLRALIDDLEVILLQIANLEAEHDLPTIEMVQRGVDQRAILLKINVAEMRRAEMDL